MVGATLSAAVMAAVLSSYIYLGRGLGRLGNQQIIDAQARRTLDYFAQDAQSATDVSITSVTAPDFYVTFSVPTTSSGATRITYYYSQAGASPSIAGTTITVPAHSLVRVPNSGSAVVGSSLTILSNIMAGDDGCYVRYFDASGTDYDSGTAPYTPTTTYSLGIKQVSLSFRTQTGTASIGNQTPPYQGTTGRLILRNRTFLP